MQLDWQLDEGVRVTLAGFDEQLLARHKLQDILVRSLPMGIDVKGDRCW
jgi:hypothetical protein